MRQVKIQQVKNYASTASVKNYSTPTSQQAQYVNTAWNFAYSALWNTVKFSVRETELAKQKIAAHLLSENPEKTLLAFCQRVLLARDYITKNPGRYIPLPSVWLDEKNTLGFSGTQRWYDQISTIRKSLPAYKTGIKALAEAVIEVSKDPSRGNYEYWRSYFIERNTPGLLNLFQIVTVQQLYQN
jgi:hypothetical protein